MLIKSVLSIHTSEVKSQVGFGAVEAVEAISLFEGSLEDEQLDCHDCEDEEDLAHGPFPDGAFVGSDEFMMDALRLLEHLFVVPDVL